MLHVILRLPLKTVLLAALLVCCNACRGQKPKQATEACQDWAGFLKTSPSIFYEQGDSLYAVVARKGATMCLFALTDVRACLQKERALDPSMELLGADANRVYFSRQSAAFENRARLDSTLEIISVNRRTFGETDTQLVAMGAPWPAVDRFALKSAQGKIFAFFYRASPTYQHDQAETFLELTDISAKHVYRSVNPDLGRNWATVEPIGEDAEFIYLVVGYAASSLQFDVARLEKSTSKVRCSRKVDYSPAKVKVLDSARKILYTDDVLPSYSVSTTHGRLEFSCCYFSDVDLATPSPVKVKRGTWILDGANLDIKGSTLTDTLLRFADFPAYCRKLGFTTILYRSGNREDRQVFFMTFLRNHSVSYYRNTTSQILKM